MPKLADPTKYISLTEASKLCSYTQEYLSLRARQKKLRAVKLGRNWVTTKDWLEEYIKKNEDFLKNSALRIEELAISESGNAAEVAKAVEKIQFSKDELLKVSKFWKKHTERESVLTIKKELKSIKSLLQARFQNSLSRLKPDFSAIKQFWPLLKAGIIGKIVALGLRKDILLARFKAQKAQGDDLQPKIALIPQKADLDEGAIKGSGLKLELLGLINLKSINSQALEVLVSIKEYLRKNRRLYLIVDYITKIFRSVSASIVLFILSTYQPLYIFSKKALQFAKDLPEQLRALLQQYISKYGFRTVFVTIISNTLVFLIILLASAGGLSTFANITEWSSIGLGRAMLTGVEKVESAPRWIIGASENIARLPESSFSNNLKKVDFGFFATLEKRVSGIRFEFPKVNFAMKQDLLGAGKEISRQTESMALLGINLLSDTTLNLSDILSDTKNNGPKKLTSIITNGLDNLSHGSSIFASYIDNKTKTSINMAGRLLENGPGFAGKKLFLIKTNAYDSLKNIDNKKDLEMNRLFSFFGELSSQAGAELNSLGSDYSLIISNPLVLGESLNSTFRAIYSNTADRANQYEELSAKTAENIRLHLEKGLSRANRLLNRSVRNFAATYKTGLSVIGEAYSSAPESIAENWQNIEEKNESVKKGLDHGAYLAINKLGKGVDKSLAIIGSISPKNNKFFNQRKSVAVNINIAKKGQGIFRGLNFQKFRESAVNYGNEISTDFRLLYQGGIDMVSAAPRLTVLFGQKTNLVTNNLSASLTNSLRRVAVASRNGFEWASNFLQKPLFGSMFAFQPVPPELQRGGQEQNKPSDITPEKKEENNLEEEISRGSSTAGELAKKITIETRQTEKITERVIETASSADLEKLKLKDEELRKEIDKVSGSLSVLAGKFSAGLSTAPNAPVNIGSSGFSIESNLQVYSLGVSRDLGIGRDLTVSGSSYFGEDKTDKLTVNANSTFNGNIYLNSGLNIISGGLDVGGGNFTVDDSGNVIAAGALTITGTTTLSSISASNDLAIGGNTTLGNATSSDIVFLNSRIADSLIPTADNVLDIGDGTNWLRWRTGYFGTSVGINGTATSSGTSLLTNGNYLIDSGGTLSINTTNNQPIIFGSGNINIPYASTTALTISNTASTTNLYISGSQYLSGITPGSILFAGANGLISQNNADLYWDNSTNRLGINNSAPNYPLDVTGAGRFASYVDASYFTATTSTATSTFAGGFSAASSLYVLQNGNVGIGTTSPSATLAVGGNGYLTGGLGIGVATTTAGVIQTSSNVYVGGSLTVIGNSTTLGGTFSDSLIINSNIKSDLIPDQNITRDLGSTSFYWRNVYTGNLIANNISAASTTIGGTQSASLTINSDNLTADTEDASLIFFRGTVVPNAILAWDSTSKKFDFNQPVFIQNDSVIDSVISLEVRGLAGQSADVFRIASSTGNSYLNVTNLGNVGIGTTSPNGILNIAGATPKLTLTDTGAGINLKHWFIQSNGGSFNIATTSDALQDTALPAFMINSTGKVGIGTASPTSDLYIKHTGGSGTLRTLLTLATTDSTSGTGASLDFAEGASTVTARISKVWESSGNLGLAFSTYSSPLLTEKLRISSSGNVGIGTTSPYSVLSISNSATTAANTPLFTIASTSAGTSTSTLMTVLANGNVGIGTTAPGAALHVNGAGSSILVTDAASSYVSNIKVQQNNNYYGWGLGTLDSTGWNAGAYFTASGGENYVQLKAMNGMWNDFVNVNNSSNGFRFTSSAGASLATYMAITSSGNVGIGTTSPYSLLSVQATAGGTTPLFVVASSTNGLATSTAMYIANNGNVGIGTASPGQKLDVIGNILASGTIQAQAYLYSSGAVYGTTGYFEEIRARTAATNFYLSNNSGNKILTIADGGNVGIGTTSPSAKLSIHLNNQDVQPYSFIIASSTPTATTTQLVVTRDGNVGIGTASPGIQLDVAGTIWFTGYAGDRAGNASVSSRGLDAWSATAGIQWWTGSAFDIGLYRNGTNSVKVTNGSSAAALGTLIAGSVGIGTTSPSAKLSIHLNNQDVQPYSFIIASSTPTATTTQFVVTRDGNVGIGTANPVNGKLEVNGSFYASSIVAVSTISSYNSVWAPSFVSWAADLVLKPNAVEAMRLTQTGSVGIGTTSPSAKLSIHLNNQDVQPYSFIIASSTPTATTTQLVVTRDGNVGIGTASPTAALDVYGKFSINSLGNVLATGTFFQVNGAYNFQTRGADFTQGLDLSTRNAFNFAGYDSTYELTGTNLEQAFMKLAPNINQSGSANYVGFLMDVTETAGLGSGNNALMDLRVGGVSKFFVKNNGNVGIGTTSPFAKLSIMGSGDGTTPLFAIGSSTLGTGTSTAFYVAPNGNVGIGTAAPGQQLEITGNFKLPDSTSSVGVIYSGSGTAFINQYALQNTFVGIGSGNLTTSGNGFNTAIGSSALSLVTTGYENMAMGTQALSWLTTGYDNVAVGGIAMRNNRTGQRNIALGENVLRQLSYGGNNNVAIGAYANYLAPTNAMTYTLAAGTDLGIGTYYYRVSYVIGGAETMLSDYNTKATTAGNQDINIANIPIYSGPLTCTARKIYRGVVGNATTVYLVTTINDNTTTTYSDTMPDATLTSQPQPNDPDSSIIIGTYAMATAASQLVVGANSYGVSQGYFGSGVYDASPVSFTLNATGGSGTDVAGANLSLAGGKGTGAGAGGYISFLTSAAAGSTGSAANSLSEIMRITSGGNVGIGTTSPFAKLSVMGSGDGTTPLFAIASSTAGIGTTTSFIISSNGNVGIGGAFSPWYTVAITGNMSVTSSIMAGNLFTSGNFYAVGASSIGTTTYYNKFTVWGSGAGTGQTFAVVNNASTTLLQVLDNGKVGIGTTSPSAKLSIHLNNQDVQPYSFIIASSTPTATTTQFVVTRDGYVGIGTASPGAKLEIDTATASTKGLLLKTTDNDATNRMLEWQSSNGTALGGVNTDGSLWLDRYATNTTSSGSYYDAYGRIIALINSGDTSSGTIISGFSANVGVSSGTNKAINGYLLGVDNGVAVGGGAGTTIANAFGNRAYLQAGGTATITDFGGFLAMREGGAWPATISITNAKGLWVKNLGEARVANAYGVYIDDQTGASSKNFGIYSAGTTNYNYFGGNVGIGTTSPYSVLSISNSATTAANTPLFTIASTSAGTSTSTLMTVLANGNVGIGTAAPGNLLDVVNSAGTASISVNASNGLSQFILAKGATNKWVLRNDAVTDDFRIYNSGATTANLVIQQGGNVGIGTTTPNNKLDIYAATGTDGIGFSGASGSTYKWTIGQDMADAGKFKISSSTALGSSDRFVIDGNGNVGIGTSTPYGKLQISAGSSPNLVLSDTNAGTNLKHWYASSTAGSLAFGTLSDNLLTITERMRIDPTGHLGVGTSSPLAMLTASSSSQVAALIDQRGSNDILQLQSSGVSKVVVNSSGYMGIGTTSPLANLSVNQDAGQYGLIIGSTTSTSLIVDRSGYVGIGTFTPSYKLTVSGSVDNYLGYIYNTAATASSSGLYIRADGGGSLLTLNSSGSNIVDITAAQSTFYNPVNIAGSGDVSIAYDLYMTNSTAGFLKFSGPGYIQTESPSDNLDLTLSAANDGYVFIDDTLQISVASTTNNTASYGLKLSMESASTTSTSVYGGYIENLITNSSSNGLTKYGLYLASSGTFTGAAGASNKNYGLYVDSVTGADENYSAYFTNNVGIGTTSPYSILSISNSATTAANTPLFTIASTSAGISTSTLMTVLANGNVGIGAASPTNGKLEITQADGRAIFITQASSGGGSAVAVFANTSGAGFYFSNSNASGWGGFFEASNAGNVPLHIKANASQTANIFTIGKGTSVGDLLTMNSSGNVGIGTTSPMANLSVHALSNGSLNNYLFAIASSSQTATTTQLVVTRDGNVGIGTTNPGAKLDVATAAGSSDTIAKFTKTGSHTIRITDGVIGDYYQDTGDPRWSLQSSWVGADVINGLFSGSATLGTAIGNMFNTSVLGLYTSNGAILTQRMAINGSGNVGIGTGQPTSLLSLGGGAARTFGMERNPGINLDGNNLTIQAGGASANMVSTVSVQTAGTGYNVGDVLTLTPVTFDNPFSGTVATVTVATLTGGAGTGVASVTITTKGSGYTTGTKATTVAPAGGTGCVINVLTLESATDKNAGALVLKSGTSTGTGTGDIQFWTSPAGATGATDNALLQRMTILSTGNVGIGTTAPGAKLEIGLSNIADKGLIIRGTSGQTANLQEWYGGGGQLAYVESGGQIGAVAFRTNNGLAQSSDTNYAYFKTLTAGPQITRNIADANPALIVQQVHGSSTGDILQLKNSSNTVMVVQQGGNVGIGTTSPLTKLSIQGTAGANDILNIASSTGASVLYVNASGNVGIGTTSPYSLLSISNSATTAANTPLFTIASTSAGISTSTLMTVLANGYVGIGTSSPNSLLSLQGAVGSGASGIQFYTNTYPARYGNIAYPVDSLNGGILLRFQSQADTVWKNAIDIGNGTNASNPSLTSYYGTNLAVTSGNVGIGTTSPWAQLSVNPNGITGPAFAIGSSTSTSFVVTNGGNVGIGTAAPATKFQLIDGTSDNRIYSSGIWTSQSLYSGGGTYYLMNTGVFKSKDIYDTGTNVGIGTTSPQALLTVGSSTPANLLAGDKYNSLYVSGLMEIGGTGTSTIASNLYVVGTLRATASYVGDLIFANNFRFTEAATSSEIQALFLKNQLNETMLTILENGNVGIGTSSPMHKLDVEGEIGARGFVNLSTREAKENINYLSDDDNEKALEAITKTKVATYNYKGEDFPVYNSRSDSTDLVDNDISSAQRLGLIAEEAPEEILSSDHKGVDLYKMTSLAFAGIKAQQKQIEKLRMDVDEIKNKVAEITGKKLESKSFISGSFASLFDGLKELGITIENGIAKFQSIITESFAIQKPSDQNQSTVGEAVILAGQTETEIKSDKIDPNSKIFVTFRGDYGSRWWIDSQATSTAIIKIAQPLAQDVQFDWWVVGVTAEQAQNNTLNNAEQQPAQNSNSVNSHPGLDSGSQEMLNQVQHDNNNAPAPAPEITPPPTPAPEVTPAPSTDTTSIPAPTTTPAAGQ